MGTRDVWCTLCPNVSCVHLCFFSSTVLSSDIRCPMGTEDVMSIVTVPTDVFFFQFTMMS